MNLSLTPTAAAPDSPVSILLVDDDPGILETLVDIFEEMGFQPQTASNGRQALALMRERFFNLALLDIRLPDMQGTELLGQARQIRPDMLCIMATGNASLPTALESLNQGAYAYLQKPIEVPHVKATVRRALEQQSLQFENRRLLEQWRALSEITDAALATLEPNELLARLLSRLVNQHSADAGIIYLKDGSPNELLPRMLQGPPDVIQAEPVELGQGLAGQAAANGEVVAAAGDDLAFDPIAARGVYSSTAAPLLWRGQLIGAIRLDRLRGEPFRGSELDQFRLFSERAGTLIGNARLYDEERRLHEEAQVFADLTSSLVEQVGVDERLHLITSHLMRLTSCSRCLVWLTGREALVCTYSAGLADPQDQRLLRRAELPLNELSTSMSEVLETGRAVIRRGADLEGLLPGDLLERLSMRAALLLPLRFEGRILGLIALDQAGVDRYFPERQVAQARVAADISAAAIQQARTIHEERVTLQTLAESFLTRPPRHAQLDLADHYEPASMVAQVGGDYYDFIDVGDGRLGIVIGDVCGKERAAAIYVAMAKYMLRAYALQDPSPRVVLTKLNQALYNEMSEECMFITMFYAIVDPRAGTITYTNAGHPPALLLQPSTGTIHELKSPATTDLPPGTPTDGMVGAIDSMQFTETQVPLEPGSVMAMFTDGVTEARTDSRMLESEGVQEVILAHAGEPAERIVSAIRERAVEFASGVLRDDVAIVVAKNG